MKNKGFTLVEMVIVIGIMAILGLILTGSLIQTLRGQNKIRVLNQVKQNGQIVLDKLTNEIRQAGKVLAVCTNEDKTGSPADTILLVNGGTYSRFRLMTPATGVTNGFIKRDEFKDSDIPDVVRDNSFSAALCTISSDYVPSSVSYLTDRDSKNGVSINYDGTNAIFTTNSQAGFGDVVTIRFKILAAEQAGSAYEETVKAGGIIFNTSVQLRGATQ